MDRRAPLPSTSAQTLALASFQGDVRDHSPSCEAIQLLPTVTATSRFFCTRLAVGLVLDSVARALATTFCICPFLEGNELGRCLSWIEEDSNSRRAVLNTIG